MTLAETVNEAVETAFAAAGDLVVESTWTRSTLGAYDPATGTRTKTDATRTVRCIEDKVSESTATRLELKSTAIRVWIPNADFATAPAIDPAKGDKLTHRGTVYSVAAASFSGAKSLWEIHADI